jgi:hypothetical protein
VKPFHSHVTCSFVWRLTGSGAEIDGNNRRFSLTGSMSTAISGEEFYDLNL